MSKPILYAPDETNFNHNGIGILSDCSGCVVVEELNGQYELEMRYPIDGIHYDDITERCIVKAKPNQGCEPQLFRIYGISKPMIGIVKVYAAHISYDLSGIPVSPFKVTNEGVASFSAAAMEGIKNNAATNCPFSFSATVADPKETEYEVKVPSSIRSRLMGSDGSMLDVFGGEFEFDNFDVILLGQRGENRGVSIRYGKNLRDIEQELNCDLVYGSVYPFWANSDLSSIVELDEKVVSTKELTGIDVESTKTMVLDLSSAFDSRPTQDQLFAAAAEYAVINEIGVPFVSLSVSYSQVDGELETIMLGDTVSVVFPALGVSTNARAVKIEYDVVSDRVENVVFGAEKRSLISNPDLIFNPRETKIIPIGIIE